MRFAAGQRWISEPEPELGLGIVLDVEPNRVKMFFPASNAMRLYAAASAPLRRVRFKVDETVRSHEGESFVVTVVTERADGVLTYGGPNGERVIETQLSDMLTFDNPGERLPAAQVDDNRLFELRLQALEHRHRLLQSPARGFTGARIDLIPHQLGIAQEVTARHLPRVLLADEVGLGKTIEASLILHRLYLTGKASRLLIIVPEPLVHQWFVELLRRFNLHFAIFDEERALAIEANNPESNPFLDDQLVLCPLGWLAGDEKRHRQVVEAGWDLLVVDEAHHLGWSRETVSPEYALVEALGKATPGLLLLTATPRQLGEEGHFARLRLLDPDRYPSLEAFLEESETYTTIAKIADKLVSGKKLTIKDGKLLAGMPGSIAQHLSALQAGEKAAAQPLLEALLDQHGIGRVMFRNTRAKMSGFPKRIAHLIPLKGEVEAAQAEDRGEAVDLSDDPRILWLEKELKKLKGAKVLLICRTREKVEAIEAALRERTSAPVALFHEGLTLLQRDRNAAFFAEEEGAQLLIASEIGSEGRNFQFAHHLVLFDLPEHPELLEQRIGRLNRIGQSADISIHVPFIKDGPGEIRARWFHEGLNAFEESLHGGAELYERFGASLNAIAHDLPDPARPTKGRRTKKSRAEDLEAFLTESAAARDEVRQRLEAGHDHLLELAAARAGEPQVLIEAIRKLDADTALDRFMLAVFDHCGAHVEDIGERTWIVIPAAGGQPIPGIPPEGTTLTADRTRALGRDDIGFLSWDHPAVEGAFELLLGGTEGNASLAVTTMPGPESFLIETVHLVEAVAPEKLHAERFLPATPLRHVVDNRMLEVTQPLGELVNGPMAAILGKTDLLYKLMPKLIESAAKLATAQANQLIATSLVRMQGELEPEIARLRDLAAINPSIKESEIEAAQQELYDLRDHLADARVRLDSVRMIFRASKIQPLLS